MTNGRQETEVTVGNRRQQTEATVSNRRQQTEVTTGNRRQESNIYTETWSAEDIGEVTDLQKYMMQISSARFDSFAEFLAASEKKKSLQGYSGKKYQIVEKLPVQGGESAVLLCLDEEGNQVVAKIFKDIERGNLSKVIQVRRAVIDFTRSEEAKGYVLPIVDVGLVSLKPKTKNYFEIQPYCPAGDLGKREAMSFQELLPVIKHLNEALNRIHQGGLLHLDIKPENLYEYEGNIVIGDFGIAHVQTEGRQVTVTTGGTDGYRSPETLFAPNIKDIVYVLTSAADYYSLGATIASLYVGHFIFDGIEKNMALIMRESHIPLPFSGDAAQMYLQNLIDGLFQYDSQHRFGYAEVNAWLKNHNFKKNMGGNRWPRPYNFDGHSCNDELELYSALAANWEKGKKQLYRKYIEQFFATFEPEIANRAFEIVEEEYPDTGDEEATDLGFFQFLKYIYPEGPIVWKEYQFNGLAKLGEEMLLQAKNTEFGNLLKRQILSMWLKGKEENDVQVEQLVKNIEALAQTNPVLACYWFGYAFAEKKKTTMTVEKFISNALPEPSKFYKKGGKLDSLTNMKKSAKEYGFLYSKGFQPVIEPHLKEMEEQDRVGKANILFQMLDEMAGKLSEESKEEMERKVRTYYRTFGPMGYLNCLQEMVTSKEVYKAETPAGKKILQKIEDTKIPDNVSVAEMAGAMKEAAALSDELSSKMQNNPFLTELGIMENKRIVCQVLSGFFCYDFLGQKVPLKYKSILEKG